jgi:hypothetical protein
MAADSTDITRRRRLSRAWLRAARRYCVMATSVKGLGLVGYTVLDQGRRSVDSRHQTPEAARRRADALVDAEVARRRRS